MKVYKRKLNKWLKDNLDEIIKVKYGELFCYYIGDQSITISHEVPDHIHWYKSYCKKLGLKYDVSDHALCLLHEIGHDQTIWFIGDIRNFIDRTLSAIVETDSYFVFTSWIKCQIYFRLPCEHEATLWAVDFINNNIEEVRKLESYYYD